jgi:hypothetical protein
MRVTICLLLFALALALGCSSDEEAPVAAEFVGGDGYNVEAGSTARYLEVLECSTVSVPIGIGESSVLRIGEYNGVSFDAILLAFDFDSLDIHYHKTVTEVFLNLPVKVVQDTLFSTEVTFNELQVPFEEEDSLVTIPTYDPTPIPDPEDNVIRTIDLQTDSFSIDESIIQQWLDDEEPEPWSCGLAVIEYGQPEEPGLIELFSRNYGTDPPKMVMRFSDGSSDTFGVAKDYTVSSFQSSGGLDCVGGVATRVFIRFSLDSLSNRAMIHGANLVFTVDETNGFGTTPLEFSRLGLDSTFYYYLYTPKEGDPSAADQFLSGTSVALGMVDPTEREKFKISTSGFIADVEYGYRDNTGLVLQSDLEGVRLQRLSLFSSDADSVYKPYLEVFYSLPADFSKGK